MEEATETVTAPTFEELRAAVATVHDETLAKINELVRRREEINAEIRKLREREAEERRARKALDKDYTG